MEFGVNYVNKTFQINMSYLPPWRPAFFIEAILWNRVGLK